MTVFEHNTPKPVTQAQQSCRLQPQSNILSVELMVGSSHLWWWGRRKDKTDQVVMAIHEVIDKVSNWPGLPIFSMTQSAPFVHSSFFLL